MKNCILRLNIYDFILQKTTKSGKYFFFYMLYFELVNIVIFINKLLWIFEIPNILFYNS
jgi:hypothetical protein